jgi:hypothetical protein
VKNARESTARGGETLQADLKPGGGRFKRVHYMNPEQEYDRGNDWVEYFQKNSIQ